MILLALGVVLFAWVTLLCALEESDLSFGTLTTGALTFVLLVICFVNFWFLEPALTLAMDMATDWACLDGTCEQAKRIWSLTAALLTVLDLLAVPAFTACAIWSRRGKSRLGSLQGPYGSGVRIIRTLD